MSTKPLNINMNGRVTAAQSTGSLNITGSFESAIVALASNEALDVSGVACVFAYGGGAVSCSNDGTTFVALQEQSTGTAITVTTARLVDVRGVQFISFASASNVVLTG